MRPIGQLARPLIPPPPKVDPRVETLAVEHGRSAAGLLPLLAALSAERGTLSQQTLEAVSAALQLPAQHVQGVATFYALLNTGPDTRQSVRLCQSPVCWVHGAQACRAALEKALAGNPGWQIAPSNCLGLCDRAPAAFVVGRQCGPIGSKDTAALVAGRSVGQLPSYAQPRPGETRLLLERMGRIDPRSIDDALAAGVYGGLKQALEQPPQAVIAAIERSGLRGRGGAGFPTGRKWRLVSETPGGVRYVVCNADESEPLAYKDRVLMESDPHSVIEGIALAAYAVGAAEGFVYIRGEYEPQAALLEHAVAQAVERGWLGPRIAGSPFSFHLHVHRGAGAYVCGEESALLESLEGKRGEPRTRPPFPAARGYLGQPTVVNNVETLAATAAIMRLGVDAYRAIGDPASPGTRLFTLSGHIGQPGIVELPLGFTLREMIDHFGGGMRPGSRFRFALVGGAAGVLVPPERLDAQLDTDARHSGLPVGAGGILVCDESVSPVEMVRELMRFFESESCGKCTPCRIGTSLVRQSLDDLLDRGGTPADLDRLRRLAETLKRDSLCGLGTSAADPLASLLAWSPAELGALVGDRPAQRGPRATQR